MKTLATNQPTNESTKQNQSGKKGRSRAVSPLSTGMPMLQRQCACGGSCPRCQEKLGIQTKLRISEPGDPYEQEADRIADQVMRMPEPFVQRQVDGEEDKEEEEEGIMQRMAIAHSVPPLIQRQEGPGNAALVFRDAPNAKTWNDAPAECGPSFCRPLPSDGIAMDSRRDLWPILVAGIAYKVSSRVLPLWNTWAFGGSSVMDITKNFGLDFTTSPTTLTTSKFLMNAIKAKLTVSPPVIPAAGFLKLDIPTFIPTEVKAINDPTHAKQMNFNVIGDIPGNIAGGIGKNQAATPIGATPSPQDDERIAKGDLTLFNAGADLMVMPNLHYTVKDTVDLCPGNCGADKEKIATIPMSQWEATGISGDVPFTVDFRAPIFTQLPFLIPKSSAPAGASPAPSPKPKTP